VTEGSGDGGLIRSPDAVKSAPATEDWGQDRLSPNGLGDDGDGITCVHDGSSASRSTFWSGKPNLCHQPNESEGQSRKYRLSVNFRLEA
jgi:hypothetical protein